MTWAYETALALDEVNLHLAALEGAGLLGITEHEGRATVYLARRADDLPLAGRWVPVPDVDWNARWRESVQPVTVGAMTIAPPWLAQPDLTTIVIEPGQAFGTGHHETTTGCLAALQEVQLTGRTVLDVGTGSGVLAIAAVHRGAVAVHAVDTDPLAVASATGNAACNGVEVLVLRGSVEAAPEDSYEVILANLDTATLCAVARRLVERLAPGGTLIASGVSIERSDEAVDALAAAGLPVHARPGREWVLLVGTKPRRTSTLGEADRTR